MSFVQHAFRSMHPLMQLVLLTCIVLTFMAIAAGAGMLWASDGDVSHMQTLIHESQTGNLDRSTVLAMNNANQILAFGLASWIFAALVGRAFLGSFFMRRPAPVMYVLAIGLALGMSPVLDWTFRLNEWALVPGSSLHTWAGNLEAQAMTITKSILDFSDTSSLLAVLFSVAVLPAICEEWLFRGTVQPILVRATGNLHVGVWGAAILFSAIHMQFFGFLPRVLLGAAFGYLVASSSSLWPGIVGHFVNNAGVVLAAWWMGPEWIEQGLEPQPLQTWTGMDWALAAGALVILFWCSRRLIQVGDSRPYLSVLSSDLGPEARKPAQTPQL